MGTLLLLLQLLLLLLLLLLLQLLPLLQLLLLLHQERGRSPHYQAATQLLVVELEVSRLMLSVSRPQAISVRPHWRGKLSSDATGSVCRNSVFLSKIWVFMMPALTSVKVSVNSDFT